MTNYKNGHTGQLAVITWLLNFVGAIARVFTTMQDPPWPLPPPTVLA